MLSEFSFLITEPVLHSLNYNLELKWIPMPTTYIQEMELVMQP